MSRRSTSRRRDRVQTSLWRADDLDAELLFGRFADFSYDLHSHETACLALITAGTIRIHMRSGSFDAHAGDLYAINADEPHAGEPVDDRGWIQRTIYVDIARLQAITDSQKGGFATIRGPIIRDPAMNQLFTAVHQLSKGGGYSLACDSVFLALAARLLDRHCKDLQRRQPTARESGAVGRARAYLDATMESNPRLADIANVARLTPFRLYRAFEREIGMTPHGYLRQARVKAACRMIRDGMNLAAVAASAGFADQAHMTRCFYRSLAVTPGAYRLAVRGKRASAC